MKSSRLAQHSPAASKSPSTIFGHFVRKDASMDAHAKTFLAGVDALRSSTRRSFDVARTVSPVGSSTHSDVSVTVGNPHVSKTRFPSAKSVASLAQSVSTHGCARILVINAQHEGGCAASPCGTHPCSSTENALNESTHAQSSNVGAVVGHPRTSADSRVSSVHVVVTTPRLARLFASLV